MAKAYGGVPRGGQKKVVTKTIYREVHSPVSNTRNSKSQINRISGAVSGFLKDHQIGGDEEVAERQPRRNQVKQAFSSVRRLEEYNNDDLHNMSGNGIMQKLNESNEASLVAVPEHH